MKFTFVLITAACLTVHAAGNSQTISLTGKNLPLKSVFEAIKEQSGYSVFFIQKEIKNSKPVTVNAMDIPLTTFLDQILNGQQLSYRITDRTIFLSRKPVTSVFRGAEADLNIQVKDSLITVKGKIVGSDGESLSGASISVKGSKVATMAGANGQFKLTDIKAGAILVVSYIGYDNKEIIAREDNSFTIRLDVSVAKMTEVVLSNGLFTRKKENTTGSVNVFSGEQLKTIGVQNVIKSLSVLEPSLRIYDNINAGSNPNSLPEAALRGSGGIPNLQTEYQNAPNLPLFILDGFEATVQKVYDLNMELIESVTVLKDASAKAIYGSKAGNGVIVIETKRPGSGALRISYSGGVNISAPDLSSYNLTNPQEKLQAEILGGRYKHQYPLNESALTATYSEVVNLVESGVYTDWLAQPVQNGIGQRHNLSVDGGGEGMRYLVSLNYNNITGTMKGSDRKTITGLVNLEYRKNNFAFRNSLSIDNNKGVNSPYGPFSTYTKLNPYRRIYDDNGDLIKMYTDVNMPNPLFNLQLNTKDFSTYTTITENFYGEWNAVKNLRLTARTGITLNSNSSELFYPAQHTNYSAITSTSDQFMKRGEYTITNGTSQIYNVDLGASYSIIRGQHQLFTNLIYSIQQSRNRMNGMSMVGFPNDKMDDISMGLEYKNGSKAAGSEQTSRTLGLTGAVNYSYKNKYLMDFSYRASGSSQFGSNNRWGSFWSVGTGWNLHNEDWIKSMQSIDQLRLRSSIGSTGTQNFSAYQSLSTYQYITSQFYAGDMGAVLMAMSNPNLRWQQTYDKNIGMDFIVRKRLTVRFDYYIKNTKDLLSDQTIAPSSGFNAYRENVGETINTGWESMVSYKLISKPAERINVNLFVNIAHNKNKIHKVSDALKTLNSKQDEVFAGTGTTAGNPVTRFEEGQSLSSIWAVQSLGIDPITGNEIFQKRDGTVSYVWNVADQVVVGDALPKLNGALGANVQYKGVTLNVAMTYQTGGQLYNSTLVQKVENANVLYNVDKRFLEGRWTTPGQYSLYKNIADKNVTKPTSRFVQDNDEMVISSVSMSFDLSRWKMIKSAGFKGLTASTSMNDLARIGRVQSERGLSYPFARNFVCSLQFNF